jgi:hypothetical protein
LFPLSIEDRDNLESFLPDDCDDLDELKEEVTENLLEEEKSIQDLRQVAKMYHRIHRFCQLNEWAGLLWKTEGASPLSKYERLQPCLFRWTLEETLSATSFLSFLAFPSPNSTDDRILQIKEEKIRFLQFRLREEELGSTLDAEEKKKKHIMQDRTISQLIKMIGQDNEWHSIKYSYKGNKGRGLHLVFLVGLVGPIESPWVVGLISKEHPVKH